MMSPRWRRRGFLVTLASGFAALSTRRMNAMQTETPLLRPIPATGETIPAVGLGTWQQFDVGSSEADRREVRETLRRFVEADGRVVDSSPMYGRAESVVGDLTAKLAIRDRLFVATKVWTSGRAEGIRQMEESFARLRVTTMDLMQVHNLVDWQTHLATLREWKAAGRVRYVGVSHYQVSAFPRLAELIRTQHLDFVQLNFSMATREAEERLLPLAADHGVAVLINRPFEGGSLFGRVRGRPLPDWCREFDCASWGQFFLKYILAAPEVTCVIPGTSNPVHVLDNLGAGRGRLPNAAQRRRMVDYLASI